LPAWLERLGGQKVLVWAGAGAAALLLLLMVAAFWLAGCRRRQVVVSGPAELPPGPEAGEALTPGGREARRVEQEKAVPELPPVQPKKSDIVATRLRDAIKKEPEASAQILRGWLAEEEE